MYFITESHTPVETGSMLKWVHGSGLKYALMVVINNWTYMGVALGLQDGTGTVNLAGVRALPEENRMIPYSLWKKKETQEMAAQKQEKKIKKNAESNHQRKEGTRERHKERKTQKKGARKDKRTREKARRKHRKK